jgi:hypothetical protein
MEQHFPKTFDIPVGKEMKYEIPDGFYIFNIISTIGFLCLRTKFYEIPKSK